MKKYLSVFIIMILSLLTVSAAADYSCIPTISLVSQDPVLATPGSYVKLVFEISGLDECKDGLTVKLNPLYPFSLDSGSDSLRVLNTNPYVLGYKSTWNVGYNLRIADDASGENYTVQMAYHSGTESAISSTFSVNKDFEINIINSLTSFDSVVQETSSSTTSIAIANTGKNAANAVIVKIPSQENYKASGTNGQMVGNLASGDYTLVSFSLTSARNFMQDMSKENKTLQNPSSESNELKIEIDYTDNIGVRRITYLNLEMPSSAIAGNSTSMMGGFGGYKRSSWSVWYTVLIILGVVIVIFILYKIFPNKSKKIIEKIFKKKKHELQNENGIPGWVKKEKEKKK
jgi:hypothetical protein